MKKNLKYASLCLMVAIGLISCEADDSFKDEPVDVGGYINLLDRSITSFDKNEDLNLSIITASGVEVESIDIVMDGSTIASATIAGENATFNASSLGDLDDAPFSVDVISTFSNGKTAKNTFSISVKDAITIDEAPSSIRLQDTTKAVLVYSTFTRAATIDDVTLMWKKGEEGTYVVNDLDLAVDADEEEIDIAKLDYSAFNLKVNDTVFFKLVAESGTLSESAEEAVVITAQNFEASSNAVLSDDSTMSLYHLGDAEYVDADGEIQFVDGFGFETLNGIEFVQVTLPIDTTASEYFNGTDLMEAEATFMDGSKMTTTTNVMMGDVFIYKVSRTEDGDTTVSYGIIKIGDTTTTNDSTNSFEFDYAEGTIVRG